MNQINESVDILVKYGDFVSDHANSVQMTQMPQWNRESKRPLYSVHKQNLSTVREYFKEKNWLLLTTSTILNDMYLCPRIEFEQKVSDHLMKSNAYKLIKECSEMKNQKDLQEVFNYVRYKIDSSLNNLYRCRRINWKQLNQLSSCECDENQITSMNFLVDTCTEVVRLRPVMMNSSSPLVSISRYLYQVLLPFYLHAARTSTMNHGFDAVQALEKFTRKGLLKATSQFFVYEIRDFDITFDHEEMLIGLEYFLSQYFSDPTTAAAATTTTTKVNLSHATIVKLVKLVFRTQFFVYDNKLYQQTKGGDPDSSLIKLLVDIYLFCWQQKLMEFLRRTKQFFCRCYNQILLTWQGPTSDFHSHFRRIRSDLPALPIELKSRGRVVHFLDAEIQQRDGILRTKVYRPRLIERYTTPYLVTYPSDPYAAQIRRHLMHTIRLCSNVEDFQDEQTFMYALYSLNGFPLHFIADCIENFCHEFNPSKSFAQYDQEAYQSLRNQCVQNYVRVSNLSSIANKRSNSENLTMEPTVKRMKT